MEGLIELVAASFARHGIDSPVRDSAPRSCPPEPTPPTALPEHSFRKKSDDDHSHQV